MSVNDSGSVHLDMIIIPTIVIHTIHQNYVRGQLATSYGQQPFSPEIGLVSLKVDSSGPRIYECGQSQCETNSAKLSLNVSSPVRQDQ